MPFNLGAPELIIILVIALLVLGPGKLPEVGSALGKTIREFRKASSDISDTLTVQTSPLPPTTTQQAPAQEIPAPQYQPAPQMPAQQQLPVQQVPAQPYQPAPQPNQLSQQAAPNTLGQTGEPAETPVEAPRS